MNQATKADNDRALQSVREWEREREREREKHQTANAADCEVSLNDLAAENGVCNNITPCDNAMRNSFSIFYLILFFPFFSYYFHHSLHASRLYLPRSHISCMKFCSLVFLIVPVTLFISHHLVGLRQSLDNVTRLKNKRERERGLSLCGRTGGRTDGRTTETQYSTFMYSIMSQAVVWQFSSSCWITKRRRDKRNEWLEGTGSDVIAWF